MNHCRERLAAALLLLACATVVDRAQEPRATVLCDGIAARLRAHYDRAAARDEPFDAVTGAPDSSIQIGRATINDAAGDTFVERFRATFNPTNALAAAAADLASSGHVEVRSLAGSPLNVIVNVDGSAGCQDFEFFLTSTGAPARPFAPLPDKGDRDGDNFICAGFGSVGHLARVDGTDAFLEYQSDWISNEYRFRVVPARGDRWGTACYTNASFRSTFTTAKVFAAPGAPIVERALRAQAAAIVERWAIAKDKAALTFGALAPSDEESAARMVSLARELEETLAREREKTPLPTFGSDTPLEPQQQSLTGANVYPVVLDGRAYVMRIGRATFGWRTLTDTLLILYPAAGERLEPVAAAIVGQRRGPLADVRVSIGR